MSMPSEPSANREGPLPIGCLEHAGGPCRMWPELTSIPFQPCHSVGQGVREMADRDLEKLSKGRGQGP